VQQKTAIKAGSCQLIAAAAAAAVCCFCDNVTAVDWSMVS